MNFLKQAGNLEGEDNLEILEEPPVRAIVTVAPPNKGKRVSTILSKRKGENIATGGGKLTADAQRTRFSKRLARTEGNMSREMKMESLMSIGTDRTFGPGWNFAEKTILLTLDERFKWVDHTLPQG